MFHHQQICIIRNKWSVKVDSEVNCIPYNVAHRKTYWVNEEITLSQKVVKRQNSQMVPDSRWTARRLISLTAVNFYVYWLITHMISTKMALSSVIRGHVLHLKLTVCHNEADDKYWESNFVCMKMRLNSPTAISLFQRSLLPELGIYAQMCIHIITRRDIICIADAHAILVCCVTTISNCKLTSYHFHLYSPATHQLLSQSIIHPYNGSRMLVYTR